MGLSNQERLSGIYRCVKGLNNLVVEFDQQRIDSYESKKFDRFRGLIAKTWHALLGKTTNSFHWFAGSSTDQELRGEPRDPWSMAVVQWLGDIPDKLDSDSIFVRESSDHKFNALEFCSVDYLLAQNGYFVKAYAYKIYKHLESSSYYLRRYDDDFVEDLNDLNQLLSTLAGECYTTFSNDNHCATAYIIHQIMEILYGPKYPWADDQYDVVTSLMSKQSFHHDFPRLLSYQSPYNLEQLAAIHIDLVKVRMLAQKEAKDKGDGGSWETPELLKARCYAMLKLVKSFHEFNHILTDVVGELKKAKLYDKTCEKILADGKKLYEQTKKTADANDDYIMEQLDCYSFAGGSIAYDTLKEADKKKKRVVKKAAKKSVTKRPVKGKK